MPGVEAFLVSTGLVAVAEFGDKTQLLALALAVRFRRPGAITAGIVVATLANHALAGALGAWLLAAVDPLVLRWAIALSFLAMAGWLLVPDTLDADAKPASSRGAFAATLVAFFLAEMGDKTQLATIALAARFQATVAVIAGTTLGLLLANVPVVVAGDRLLRRVPMRIVHRIAAALFAAMGVAVLLVD
jgi:putative Ca2+/H+ antiporter (TMEM165/GDT1 family)